MSRKTKELREITYEVLTYLGLLPGWDVYELYNIQELDSTVDFEWYLLFKVSLAENNNEIRTNNIAPPASSYEDQRAEGTTDMGPTTTNEASAPTVVAKPALLNKISGLMMSTNTYIPTIEEYFARPVVLLKGILQASDGPSTFPTVFLPSGLLNLYPPYTQKLKGSFGFKGDIVLTLQVNGNRFQQGRYILYAVPLGGVDPGANTTISWTRMKEFTLTQVTQLPHVQFDIACDTQAVLKLPFVSSEACWSVQNIFGSGLGDLYYYRLRAMVPLASVAGSSAADFTLWAHFENVVLTGATSFQSSFDDSVFEQFFFTKNSHLGFGC